MSDKQYIEVLMNEKKVIDSLKNINENDIDYQFGINSIKVEEEYRINSLQLSNVESKISNMIAVSNNYAFRPLYSCRKYIGKVIVFCKRVVRKCLKWYIEPVCDQQTLFNNSTVEATQYLASDVKLINEELEHIKNEFEILKQEINNYKSK